jgi:FixJ family two-component response regulator
MSKSQENAAEHIQRKVVVVDDDPRVRQSLESLLSSAKIDVCTFSSAVEVLASGTLEGAACLITDIRMPVIDGWELQRRTTVAHPHLRLIFVTAHQDQGSLQRAITCGAFAFFYKPFDGEELLRTVEAAFQLQQDQRRP